MSVSAAEIQASNSVTVSQRAWVIGLTSLYVLSVVWNHRTVVGPLFDYYGLGFQDPSLTAGGIAYLFAILPAFWLPVAHWRPSYLVCYILYFTVYIPGCIVPACSAGTQVESVFQLQLYMLFAFGVFNAFYLIPLSSPWGMPLEPQIFWRGMLLFSVFVCIALISAFGLSLRIHSFEDVYAIRDDHRTAASQRSNLLIYLLLWEANVIAPALFVGGWLNRKLWYVLPALFAEILIYSITGYKHVIVAVPFLLGTMLVLQIGSLPGRFSRMALGASSVVIVCGLSDIFTGGFYLSSMFVRRVVLTPGIFSYFYYEYFSTNPKALLGHSILRNLIDDGYGVSPAAIIGDAYFGSELANANGHLWADGYANFGLLGMVMASCLLGLFCWVYDGASRRAHPVLASALLAIPAIALANTGLLTTIRSNGLGLCLAVVLFYPWEKGISIAHRKEKQ